MHRRLQQQQQQQQRAKPPAPATGLGLSSVACAGLMLPKAAAEEGADSPYVFDCSKRNDFTADGRRCPDGETDP